MALTVEQMARLDRLLDQVLDLEPKERHRWIEQLPEAERDLLPVLRDMLSDESAARQKTLPKFEQEPASTSFKPGEHVGPYKLLRPLGKGGMAWVWLARRADGCYEREVALKLPVVLQLRGDMAQRFARERDILASLEHPNIARFYDAGVSQEALPYLALEYVRGKSITSWCDAHRLGIRPRIELFLQVLDAVQYAHEHGVLHRDIKPSNVLVTESGQTRLLDFGVARFFEHSTDGDLTEVFGQALTPQYASPEQVKGEQLAPTSDVYSLGVLLYELLCGLSPTFQDKDRARQLPPSRIVGEKAALGRATSASHLVHVLRGDLDAIALKALDSDPLLRYETAAALARDLQRYLAGNPVLARTNTLSYRGAKFVLRNRNATTTGVIAVALGAGFWAYTYLPQTQAPPSAQATATRIATAADDKSIAVLPFVDLSEKKDQEYFSDGLSEELIDRLSHSSNLKVIARTSSFAFKGKNEDIRSIAAKLGVAHLLEGSVRRSGKVLRVTAQLVRASDGVHLWSQTYDRQFADIFQVQDEIAGTVVTSLNAALKGSISSRSPSKNLEAYNLYLQGNYLYDRFTRADVAKSIELYQQAIALDANFALAWERSANAYLSQGTYGWVPVRESNTKARVALEHALKLDPNLSSAHDTLGHVFMNYDWDWNAARAQFHRALELDPDRLHAASNLAYLYGCEYGQWEEAIKIERKIIALDPLDVSAFNDLSLYLYLAGRYEDSVAAARHLILLNPSYASAYAGLAYPLLYLGRFGEAHSAAQKEADEDLRLQTLPITYWALGQKAESDAALRELETKYADVSAYDVAEVYAYRGQIDRAFQWLERAYQQRDPGMPMVRIDPLLRNLHKDLRYQAVLAKMKLNSDAPEPRN